MGALRIATSLALACALASGCVFEDTCVGGAVRDEASGRCSLGGGDAGPLRDGGDSPDGSGMDAGPGTDGGDAGGGGDAGPPRRIAEVSVGAAHICVIDNFGVLTCWGANLLGQLATGDVSPQDTPVDIDLGGPVTRVTGSTITSCAATNAPATFCWGSNEHGQIGNSMVSAAPVTTPFLVPGLGASSDLYASFATTCHAAITGTVTCWGRNADGELGIGTTAMSQPMPGMPMRDPMNTDPLEGIVEVAVGDKHVCARSMVGLYCVGNNSNGVLGDGTTANTTLPVETFGLGAGDITAIAAAQDHSCAIVAGQTWCWGRNDSGEVDPTAPGGDVLTPLRVDVNGLQPTQIVTGDEHTCALVVDGTVYCWGSNTVGQLGDPAAPNPAAAPLRVPGLTNVQQISAAYGDLTCALDIDGALFCWGRDLRELLGSCAAGTGATMFLNGSCRQADPLRVDPYAAM